MIRIPLYPEYSTVAKLLKILNGKSVQDFKNMWNAVWELTGTPQNTVDWTDPDKWIDERLKGKDKDMANAIWIDSNKEVNPRWIKGAQFIINKYELTTEVGNVYKLTTNGVEFMSSIDNSVIRKIDVEEGIIQILRQLSVIKKGKRSDLLNEWEEYTNYNSNIKRDSVRKDYLRRRLVNLMDREYVSREGNTYSITDKGLLYLEQLEIVTKKNPIVNKEAELNRKVEKFNQDQREILKEYLTQTTPYQFEHIIEDLLSSMGYEDVQVTSPTNDKGIDVTGISQNGITTVKEVIQVKRNISSNVGRPILDALRGCLHRFDAFQGTIITLSDFTTGAKDAAIEKGAAPLTLINGDKLIDLLIDNSVGVNKKATNYYVIDEKYFEEEEVNAD